MHVRISTCVMGKEACIVCTCTCMYSAHVLKHALYVHVHVCTVYMCLHMEGSGHRTRDGETVCCYFKNTIRVLFCTYIVE